VTIEIAIVVSPFSYVFAARYGRHDLQDVTA
jgi:hypothetical protein